MAVRYLVILHILVIVCSTSNVQMSSMPIYEAMYICEDESTCGLSIYINVMPDSSAKPINHSESQRVCMYVIDMPCMTLSAAGVFFTLQNLVQLDRSSRADVWSTFMCSSSTSWWSRMVIWITCCTDFCPPYFIVPISKMDRCHVLDPQADLRLIRVYELCSQVYFICQLFFYSL